MCRLQNKVMCDYQLKKSDYRTDRHMDTKSDAGQSDGESVCEVSR